MLGRCQLCRGHTQPTSACVHPATYKVFYTDYPFLELGDKSQQLAPVREILFHSYDGTKYCKVFVLGGKEIIVSEIKMGYIYLEPGRLGEVPIAADYLLERWNN